MNLEDSNWHPEDEKIISETLTSLGVIDLFSTPNLAIDELTPEIAQRLYGFYFEKSIEVLKSDDDSEFNLWKNSVNDIFVALVSAELIPALCDFGSFSPQILIHFVSVRFHLAFVLDFEAVLLL